MTRKRFWWARHEGAPLPTLRVLTRPPGAPEKCRESSAYNPRPLKAQPLSALLGFARPLRRRQEYGKRFQPASQRFVWARKRSAWRHQVQTSSIRLVLVDKLLLSFGSWFPPV